MPILGSHKAQPIPPGRPLIARDVILHTGLVNSVATLTDRHGQGRRVWAEVSLSRDRGDVTATLTFSQGMLNVGLHFSGLIPRPERTCI